MTAATALTQHPNVWSSERCSIGLHTSQNEVCSQIGQASRDGLRQNLDTAPSKSSSSKLGQRLWNVCTSIETSN